MCPLYSSKRQLSREWATSRDASRVFRGSVVGYGLGLDVVGGGAGGVTLVLATVLYN